MKTAKIYLSLALIFLTSLGFAQLKSTPSGGNKRALVREQIGITDVTINYSRPGVKGREGKIYGTPIVHTGFINKSLEYGTATAAPWRAGANENTIIEFSTDVKIEGKGLPAGKYGFFIAYGPTECTVIFSKTFTSWGNYFYTESEDALRVKVKPVALDKSVEWLKYEFTEQTDNSAVVTMQWEKLSIPFKVEVDLNKTQIASFRDELKGEKGFSWETWNQAAQFCLQNDVNFEEGLRWSKFALSAQKNFQTYSTTALLCDKLGKGKEADSLMKEALPMGSMTDLHQYGKRLIGLKKSGAALEVFKLNAKKNPKQFTTYIGLARGYSANGDYKNALSQAKLALPLVPDATNKSSVENMIKKLESGQDIN